MNYITHLNAVFKMFFVDKRLKPSHISMYMAFFQMWNIYRFPDEFHINREEIMRLSKIGSTTTYHRCLKNLNAWKYIKYIPSHNIYAGSVIRMPIFGITSDTTNDTTTDTSTDTTTATTGNQPLGQLLTHNTNINKQEENNNKTKLPKNEIEVLDFFKINNWPSIEGSKFYNYYTSIAWKISGKIEILNWHSTAKNWMIKADEIKKEKVETDSQKESQKWQLDRLNVKTDKNYGEPL